MNIILCEENAEQLQEIKELLIKILFAEEDVELLSFSDGQEMMNYLVSADGFHVDMIFMDVKMQNSDGLQIARQLYEEETCNGIVFVTSHKEYVFLGYQVHAYDFILKPVTEEKLKKVIRRYKEELTFKEHNCLIVQKRTGRKKIFLDQVLYFISDKRKIIAVMDSEEENVEFYMTMKELADKISRSRFIRCHQSYFVNGSKVMDWNTTNLTIKGNVKIPVSKRYKEEVKGYGSGTDNQEKRL